MARISKKIVICGVAFDSLLQNIRLKKSPSKIAFMKYTRLKQIVQCTTLISGMTILFQRIIIPYQRQPTMSQGSRNWFANTTSSGLCPEAGDPFWKGSLFSSHGNSHSPTSYSLLEMASALVGVF